MGVSLAFKNCPSLIASNDSNSIRSKWCAKKPLSTSIDAFFLSHISGEKLKVPGTGNAEYCIRRALEMMDDDRKRKLSRVVSISVGRVCHVAGLQSH